jgi:hypothetical protein
MRIKKGPWGPFFGWKMLKCQYNKVKGEIKFIIGEYIYTFGEINYEIGEIIPSNRALN